MTMTCFYTGSHPIKKFCPVKKQWKKETSNSNFCNYKSIKNEADVLYMKRKEMFNKFK